MFLCQLSLHNRTNCMNHMITGQIKRWSNLCLPCRFFMSLFYHHIIAIVSKLNSCISMNAIINTIMARLIAACHTAICRIYDCPHLKSCNIAPPDIKIRLCLPDICQCDNLVSPGYTFARYGCSSKMISIHFFCSFSATA